MASGGDDRSYYAILLSKLLKKEHPSGVGDIFLCLFGGGNSGDYK